MTRRRTRRYRKRPVPSEARFLADLSPAMSKALVRCNVDVVLVAKGPEEFGVSRQTLDALLRHDLVRETATRRGTKVWRPTANGRRVLGAAEPRLLAARSDALYTTEPGEAMRDDPGEAVSGGELEDYAIQSGVVEALTRGRSDRELLAERADLGRRLVNAKVLAEERGVDARSELRQIEERIAVVEAKVLAQQSTALDRAA